MHRRKKRMAKKKVDGKSRDKMGPTWGTGGSRGVLKWRALTTLSKQEIDRSLHANWIEECKALMSLLGKY